MPNGRHSHVFEVEEPDGPGWKDALKLLADGYPVVCMGIGLTLSSGMLGGPVLPGSALTVSIRTWRNLRTITAQQAETEIDNAEIGVAEIRERSPQFARLVAGRPIAYELLDGYEETLLATKDQSGFRLFR